MSTSKWTTLCHAKPDIGLRRRAGRRAIVTAAAAALPFAMSLPVVAAQAPPILWDTVLQATVTTRTAKLEWFAPDVSGQVTYRVQTAPKWLGPKWLDVPPSRGGMVVVVDNRPLTPTQTTITGLQPGRTYIFRLVATLDGRKFGSIGPVSAALDPLANLPWPRPFSCVPHPPMTPPTLKCLDQSVLAAIDLARKAEGIGPMALPTDYPELSAPEQILVVTNSERGSRGLPTVAGLTARLGHYAEVGARSDADPYDPAGDFESNWVGTSDPLQADFAWMYWDGPGSGNLDCTTPTDSGCWGHRHSILGGYGLHPEMGAAVYGTASAAQIFEPGPSTA
jgi:hypothetical protein